ncbi:hypothetical protein BJ912DRAFT_29602 [Pholiota molesta]|nr:hypothetical protein BJ912DRAFT_29602 [Pholiota molesta]
MLVLLDEAFKLLQQQVAATAFDNSAQRIDPPRCHRDTRVAVMDTIYDWIMQSADREQWLLWLNGAVGAGKSAVMQSLAERCVQAAIAVASFFFSRADSTRNTITPLVATLAYQLIQAIPETLGDVLLTIEHNPLIFVQSLESQLQGLIIQPLLRLPRHLQRLFVLFIDGLDECNDRLSQSYLINILGDVSRNRNIPVVFLVSGRREAQIEAAFRQDPVANLLRTLSLDEISASDDIRRFLNNKFSEIKATHLRKHLLAADWPPMSVVGELVAKSSGQFIFASVVINYISSPRANPSAQLEVIRGIRLRDASSQNPFALLDALYQHIFSQVEALDMVINIIAYILILEQDRIPHIEHIFLLEAGDVEVLFADLIALITCEHATLKFLHASLPDFLLDKSRAQKYHIDLDEYRTTLLCMLLERPPRVVDAVADLKHVIYREQTRLIAILRLLNKVKASERLRIAFTNFKYKFYNEDAFTTYDLICPEILYSLKRLEFSDQGEAYRHVVDVFAAEWTKYWHSRMHTKDNLQWKTPDLMARISFLLFSHYQPPPPPPPPPPGMHFNIFYPEIHAHHLYYPGKTNELEQASYGRMRTHSQGYAHHSNSTTILPQPHSIGPVEPRARSFHHRVLSRPSDRH